jgi:hypothetical protein
LHQRENEQQAADKSHEDGPQRPRKKRKIVIHSSPYWRCVQTSTAVAAGISQYQPPATPQLTVPSPSKQRNGTADKSPLAKAPEGPAKGAKYGLHSSTLGPLVDRNREAFPKASSGPEKILLRIDAFLGEWLSPDYYEDITPPPNSTMMVASAKADLLRRGDYIQEMSNTSNSKGFFPGGWVAKGTVAINRQGAAPMKGSLASMAPFRERSNSQGSESLQRTKSRENVAALAPPVQLCRSRIYEPPVPSYSVSPADPLPRGYFAHAREACIRVDYQWDSMRPPQEWGDGGEYGDEWSTMHKRFRRGLAGMMEWYREHGAAPPKEQTSGFMFKQPLRLTPMPVTKRPTEPMPSLNGDLKAQDDEELILILLTHGAGCNALLGAISNQPVLIDVGLASLSMAVLRDEPRKPSESAKQERRPSVADPGMSETYDMKLMASVDHLKAGVDPSKLRSQSQASSPAVPSSSLVESRKRSVGSPGASSPGASPFPLGEPYRNWNSSLGSTRRTSSSGSNKLYTQSNLNPSGPALPATGLWTSAKTTPAMGTGTGEVRSSSGADTVLDFASQQSKAKPNVPNAKNDSTTSIAGGDDTSDVTNGLAKLNTNEEREVSDSVAPLVKPHARTGSNSSTGLWGAKPQAKSNAGLWGPPRLDDVYEHRPGVKRRWTLNERDESL